jgi:hypothetical protein
MKVTLADIRRAGMECWGTVFCLPGLRTIAERAGIDWKTAARDGIEDSVVRGISSEIGDRAVELAKERGHGRW